MEKSLDHLHTDHVDLFLVHDPDHIDRLAPVKAARTWVEKQKAADKMRFLGFSAHKNMDASMTAGAELGWIDGMMATYNIGLIVDRAKRLHIHGLKPVVGCNL